MASTSSGDPLPPLAFLGGGQMAEAFIRGLLSARLLEPAQVAVSDLLPQRREELARALGVRAAPTNLDALQHAAIVFLAVKPQDVPPLLDEVGGDIRVDQLVISIAAGVSLATLQRRLPHHPPVIRVMPNSPSLVQAGMAVLAAGAWVQPAHEAVALRIFNHLGRAVVLPEKHLDAVTALSGSGPAYLALVAEALADAGVRVGLPREVALMLAAQTMLGTGRLLADTGLHPALLKDRVASPGGTSIAGLHVLEQGGLRGTLIDAVVAAAARSAELGHAAEE